MQRLLAILAWLATHEQTTIAELADRFGVTPKQITNDLLLAGSTGFGDDPFAPEAKMLDVWIDDEDGAVHAYRLDTDLVGPTRLSAAEAFAVLAAGQAALDLDPSLAALRSAMDKLARALDVEVDDIVDVHLGAPACLPAFRAAVEAHERLRIGYWSAWRNAATEREVDPLYVLFRDGAWYARCIDHSETADGESRLFRLDRVTACTPTGERFEAGASPERPPGGGQGRGRSRAGAAASPADPGVATLFDPPADSRAVTLRFPATARWALDYLSLRDIRDEPVRDEDRDEDSDEDGRGDSDEHRSPATAGFTAVLDVVGEAFLDQVLVRTRAQVLAPEDLRGRTAVAARAILRRYE